MSIGTLLIRADASTAIGTGHVMRCLALAQTWQDLGGKAAFAMAQSTPAIQKRLTVESCDVWPVSCCAGSIDDVRQTTALAEKQKCEWVVIDGYQFKAEYQRGLKSAGFKILFLDDWGHSEHYLADAVLNQNASAASMLYSGRERYTRLLLGPRYALLRREFNAWRGWKRAIGPTCNRALVMMGGGDAGNVTGTVLEALSLLAMPELETTVVVGGSNPHVGELQDQVAQSGLPITLLKDITNVGEAMA